MKERQRWQPEEDALLRAYVRQYGPKEWNFISHRMPKPLHRDPKSCLERWKNYLKPGIKKGSLTPEEQTLVISLQSKYGNKWKKIAAEVPGRTAKRLGKWWEVFKEKQLKQLDKSSSSRRNSPDDNPPDGSPENAAQGKYDHILETFAEKYVLHQNLPLPMSIEPACPVSVPVLPPWTAASTPSPSVSLTLSPSPSEPPVLDPVLAEVSFPAGRFTPVHQQVATLMQYCKEAEESRQSWLQHKKEATWRLNRLEQQLDSEKSRKRREKMEEIEAEIRRLREEEAGFVGRVECEYREELNALVREAEVKEAKLMEAWSCKHLKLANLVEKLGLHSHGGFTL